METVKEDYSAVEPVKPPAGSEGLQYFIMGDPTYWTFMYVYTNFGVCFQVSKESSREDALHTYLAVSPCCGGTLYAVGHPTVTTRKNSITSTNTMMTRCGLCYKMLPCVLNPTWHTSLDDVKPDLEIIQAYWNDAPVNPLLRGAVMELLFSRVDSYLAQGEFKSSITLEHLDFPRGAP